MLENVRYCAKSDVGLRRYSNEDHALIDDRSGNRDNPWQRDIALAIADGLGGHAAGEIASRMACEEVLAAYFRDDLPPQDDLASDEWKVRKLEGAFRSAHNRIIALAKEDPALRGMGTTLSVLVLAKDRAIIGHVGDSRIYRRRDHRSERMTADHTKSQALIDMGHLLPEEGRNPWYGHILTHAIGGYDDLTAVFTRVEDLRKDDLFLLCTDGLHGLVTDPEIQEILCRDALPQTQCDALIEAALRKGGDDNVTVVVIQV